MFALTFAQGGWSEENSEGGAYFDLGTVVVTATRTPHLLEDVAVSATVVTREEIDEVNAQSIGEALEGVVGVKVDTYGSMGMATSIRLRGSTPNQVLVLVDGRPVNLPSLGTVDLSMYPVDNVERIEVIRGPVSALYGANALGGVINIITKDVPEEPFTEASASYGTFNTQIYRLNHGVKIDSFGYLITGSKNSSDGDKENSECDGYHFTGKVNYDLGEEAKLTFSTGYSRQDKGVPGSTSWPTPKVEQDDEKNWFDLTYKLASGENSDITSKIFFNRHWQEYKDPDSFTDDISKNYQLGVDLQQNLFLSDAHTLTWGINWERDEVDIKDINEVSKIGGERELTTKAVYLQDEITLSELLTLTLGLRYDHHSVYGSEVSPRASCLYKLTEKTSLRTSVGCAFRAPTVNELYWRDSYAVGNPDLKPEESIGYDLGIEHQFNTKVLGRVSLFRSDVDDLLTWDDPDGDWIWEPYNVEKARVQGIEAGVKTQFTRLLSSAFTYTYLDTRDDGETYKDKYLRYRPRHKGGCRLTYENERGLKVGLGVEYSSSVYTDRANTSKLGSFLLLNARISRVVAGDTELFIAGENLLDEEYQLYDGYPMPGASITGGLKAKF
jgi:outer membrane receptor for ferrienterochelin and colicins